MAGLAAQALAAHLHGDGDLVIGKGDFRCGDMADDDVPRRGDADAIGVDRHGIPAGRLRRLLRRTAGVIAAIGGEEDAGHGLAALPGKHGADGIANGGAVVCGLVIEQPRRAICRGYGLAEEEGLDVEIAV